MAISSKIKKYLDSLLSPACIVDPNLTLKYSNTDFIEMSKISEKDIHNGIHIKECLDLDIFNNGLIENALKNKKNIKLHNLRGKRSNGERVLLCLSLIPASVLFENTDQGILTFSDLTIEEDMQKKYKDLYEKEKRERETLTEFNLRLNELVDEKTHKLKRVYAELSKELEIARTVQDGLLPKELPNIVSMDIASAYIPTGKVGGDLYDILITKDRKIALLIFDVSGHGVPAALIAAMAKMLFTYYLEKGGSPAQIFSEINLRLCKYIQTGHYITAFLGIIDPSSNTMIYSRAGHSLPIIYRNKSKEISYLHADSIFIGHPSLVDIAKYNEESIDLEWEDKLLLYTDGITESINPDGEMYSLKHLTEIVRKTGDTDPDTFIKKIIEDNEKFRKGYDLEDDFTLLCIQFGCRDEILKMSGFTKKDSPGVVSINTHQEIEGICSIILKELDKKGYPSHHFFQAHLCIHEMLSNAIRHGNKFDADKKVIALYKVTMEALSISVIDEGDGFDYMDLPDPLTEENLIKDHGRGLFLVKNYMDDVTFNKKGNRIMAIKYLKQDT